MARLGAGWGRCMLAIVAFTTGCGGTPVDPQQALAAFRELAAKPDLSYRFTVAVIESGDLEGATPTAVGVVAGQDSAYRMTFDGAGGVSTSDLVLSGDQAFRRSGAEPWEAGPRARGLLGGDMGSLLPLLADAPLQVGDTVGFEGASLHQVANTQAIPLAGDREAPAAITRLELLIADDGTPVRVIVEFNPGASDATFVVVVEFRYTEFGGQFSIQPPVLP